MPESPVSRRQHNPDIIYETEHAKGSWGTCIPQGVITFFHTAFTAHSDAGAEAVGRRLQALVRLRLGRCTACPFFATSDPLLDHAVCLQGQRWANYEAKALCSPEIE